MGLLETILVVCLGAVAAAPFFIGAIVLARYQASGKLVGKPFQLLVAAFAGAVAMIIALGFKMPAVAGLLGWICIIMGIVQFVRRKPSLVWWSTLVGEIITFIAVAAFMAASR